MLRAIAVYEYKEGGEISCREMADKKHVGRFSKDKTTNLTGFEEEFLKQFMSAKDLSDLVPNQMYVYEKHIDEFYHFRRFRTDTGDYLLLARSDKKLTDREPYYLLGNMLVIAEGRSNLKLTLTDILEDRSYKYTSQDVHWNKRVSSVNQEVEATKGVMLENIDKVLERGERLEVLVDKTAELERSSLVFLDRSKALKESYYCCGGARTFFRRAAEKAGDATTAVTNAVTPSPKKPEPDSPELK